MERYLLCGEILSLPQTRAVYKGRRRGTVEFFAIHKHDKTAKDSRPEGSGVQTSKGPRCEWGKVGGAAGFINAHLKLKLHLQ